MNDFIMFLARNKTMVILSLILVIIGGVFFLGMSVGESHSKMKWFNAGYEKHKSETNVVVPKVAKVKTVLHNQTVETSHNRIETDPTLTVTEPVAANDSVKEDSIATPKILLAVADIPTTGKNYNIQNHIEYNLITNKFLLDQHVSITTDEIRDIITNDYVLPMPPAPPPEIKYRNNWVLDGCFFIIGSAATYILLR